MAKIRKNSSKNFSTKSNIISQDKRLSFKGRGIFDYMWSLPDDWNFSVDLLAKNSEKDGKASVSAGLKELETYGYLYRKQVRKNAGKFASDMIYDLFDDPRNNINFDMLKDTEIRKSDIGTENRLSDVRKSDTNKIKIPYKERYRDILTIKCKQVDEIFLSYIEMFSEEEKELLLQEKDLIVKRIAFNLDKSVDSIKSYVTVCINNELKKLTTFEAYNTNPVRVVAKEYSNKKFTEEEKAIASFDWVATLGEEENEGEKEYGN